MRSSLKVTFGCTALAIFLPFTRGLSQSYLGLTSSQNVITDVFTNPAFAVTNDDFQINVAGASGYAGSTAYTLKTKGINAVLNGVSNPYFSPSTDHGSKAIWGNADFLGPAVSFKVKKKYYFAVTTRLRYILNLDNLNNDAFSLMGSQPKDTSKSYNINNVSFNNQLFGQIGVSYGGIITSNEENMFTGGISLNYMMGYGAAGFTVPQGSFKVDQSNGIHDMQGNANVAFTPYANTWLSKGSPLGKAFSTPVGSGMGLDMGVVYTYSPLEGMDAQSHGYLIRLAASITDIGSINYTASSTTGSYAIKEPDIDLNYVNKDPNHTYGTLINHLATDSIVVQKGSASKFKMGLPTAMHLSMDLKLGTHFYLNAASLINLRAPSTSDYATHYVTSIGMAGRYESKYFSFGLPFSVNTYKKGNLGAIIYVGPFYIGSTSLFTSVIGNTMDSFDMYAGFHFILNKKKEKYGYIE